MGKIRQLREDQLINGGSQEHIYPITHARAVYSKDKRNLQDILEGMSEGNFLKDGSITTPKIGSKAVTVEKLAEDSVTTDKIKDESVTEDKLAESSVGTSKIKDGAVTNDKVANDSLTRDKLDPELRNTLDAATGLPEDLIETIQNVDKTLKDHQSQLDDKQSQINDKQQQITANDKDISLLQTRSTQMEETIKSIAATGGASQATAVSYDNEKSGLTAVNAQAAIDEVLSKLSDLALTKDAVSSLVTKTETIKKESGESITFIWTHQYFKKGTRLQLVVENPNGNVSELIQISVYSVKTDGNLEDGYATIVENYRTVTDNKFVLNIVFPADGYLFFNWGGESIKDNDTLTCKYTVYGSLSQEVEDTGKTLEKTRNEISKLVSAVPVLQEEVKKRTSSDAIDAWTHLYFYKGTRLHLEVSTIVGDISDLVQMSVYSVKTDGNLGDGYETIIENFREIKNDKFIIDVEYPKDGYLFFNLGHDNSLIGKEITIKYAVYATISQNNVKQEFFSTKDAVSSLVTKTDSLTKESNQSIVNMWTHLFFKKDTRLQLVVENPNGNASELLQISAYSIEEDNKIEAGHYVAIAEGYNIIEDNKFVLNIVFPADGYLFFNWGGEPIKDNNTLTCKYTVYGSLSQEVSNLNTRVEGLNTKVEELSVTKELDNIQKAISVLHNVNRLDVLSPVNDNVYINVVGDSIMAFQSSYIIADEGVTNVPPTCDKKANCYFLWKAISWGDCKYARFDKGKKSLVGQWDNTISDDSAAFFTENGTFKTEYIGATMRDKFPQIDGIQVSTIINAKSFPYQFDESENGWWQRNIPKRFSNEANASVSFVIPKGYKYFDFLYHAHIHGDNNVTIAISNGKKVKICTNFENDFSLKENISNYTLDTSYTPTGDHDDKYGVPNQRLHFEIEDVSTDTVVTITKSNDTSKYFIYWGISYWGTELSPYSLQINNFAIGGYGVESVNAIRESMFKGTYCDGIILEVCANTVCATRNVLSYIQSYFTEYKDCLNKEHPYKIDMQKVGVWIPHLWNKNFENSEVKSISYINNKGACKIVKDLGYNLLFNIQNVFDSVRLLYSPNVSEKDFINQYDGGNGVHLNTDGYKIYFPVWKSII